MMLWWLFGFSPWEATEAVRVRTLDGIAPATIEDRLALDGLVADLVRAAPTGKVPPALATRATALGCSLRVEDGIAVLSGRPGWVLVAVRLGPATPWVLEAPHPWFDLGTGELTDRLFRESDVRAAVFATVHRHLGPETDAAHAVDGTFHTVTLAIVEALEAPLVVQVHGFGKGHTDAAVVVGGWGADRLALALSAAGWPAVDGTVVPALGGRTNVTVRALTGRAPVAHLELSRPTRKRLRASAEERARLWTVLRSWAR
jgi:hypothetical protein